MQLKTIISIWVILVSFSCEAQKETQETLIISKIYNDNGAILKKLPRPPAPLNTSELDTLESNTKISNLKPLEFKYAINQQFIEGYLDQNLKNVFTKFKSKKLFDRIKLSDQEMKIVYELPKITNLGTLNKQAVNRKTVDTVLFINQSQVDKLDKKKYGIDGVISFTKVAFNNELKKAVLGVQVYRSGLDSSYTLYFLEKTDANWEIKYYKVLSIS